MTIKSIFILGLLAFVNLSAYPEPLGKFVNPNIGTAHCRWFFYTPAAMPFGMAKLGPSTNGHYGNSQGWEAVGYDARHTSIEGFANFHEFQVGGIVLAPITGKLQTIPGTLENPEEGYRSRFNRKNELATSGYYSVLLDDYNIRAELTATKRVGFQRYTFPQSKESHIIFDIGNRQGESGAVKDAQVTYTDDGRVEGFVITEPEYVKKYQKGATVAMYFSAVLDKKPAKWGTFRHDKTIEGARLISGEGAGLYLSFSTKANEKVTVKIGLSYTSIANARLNLQREAKNLSFDAAKKQTLATWETYLGRIKVTTTVKEDKVKFYTGLFHALLGRGLASDVNGAYPKNNGEIGQIELDKNHQPIHNHYNTDAIWGGFWNLTQLWALAYPEYYADWVQSQLLVYKETGWLGDGIACSKYVSGVGTNFTGLAIASAYNCGIRNFDVTTAYQAALKNELTSDNRIEGAGKMDVGQFVKRGYSPFLSMGYDTNTDGSGFAASHTLEYSFSAYAVAQFAKLLNKTDDYNKLIKLSEGWKMLYDPSTKFIRPRNEKGEFIDKFNPTEPWRGFQEGNATQYTFYVPHNPEALINIVGKETFNNRLDSIFTLSQKNVFGGGTTIDAFAGLATPYNHGNQPNLHISWLFNFSGKPYLTQKWVRAICDQFYGTEEIHGYGYGQDEDQGQLGAWFVLAGIGLFDVKGLTEVNPGMQIGSPLFDSVTIKLNPKYYKGKKFSIKTINNSKVNPYVQRMSLNNQTLGSPFIKFSEIVNGGTLILNMGHEPLVSNNQ
ncbi:MAG TPA: GH92 family glycosyl hydrolase [Prolixibacteraceae bacterium]|jgi:predicted alpha-1,2-mannosidase